MNMEMSREHIPQRRNAPPPSAVDSHMSQSMVNPATRSRIHMPGAEDSEFLPWLEERGQRPRPGCAKMKLVALEDKSYNSPQEYTLQGQKFIALVGVWHEFTFPQLYHVVDLVFQEWSQEEIGESAELRIRRRYPLMVEVFPEPGKYPLFTITPDLLKLCIRKYEQPFLGLDYVDDEEMVTEQNLESPLERGEDSSKKGKKRKDELPPTADELLAGAAA